MIALIVSETMEENPKEEDSDAIADTMDEDQKAIQNTINMLEADKKNAETEAINLRQQMCVEIPEDSS